MTKASLLECAVAFYSEGWSIEHIGRPVDVYFDYKSEFLNTNYIDFWLGGLDDMSNWT